MHLSVLDQTHVAQYRELMLEAYDLAADAFTSTAEDRRAEPQSWWHKRVGAEGGPVESFGAWIEGELIGTVALEYSSKPKTRHVALVLGMYVKPKFRGQGVAHSLMLLAGKAAEKRSEVLFLTLTLTEGNSSAHRLYERLGFSVWGIEPMAIRTPTGFKGKVYMSMPLQRGAVAA